ncbi:c-type cytochrome [Thauera aromatica]|uniref:4-cresol dehydrogenase cytochrome c PchC n=1 Tax=Thauera aromatica K172 TaxID=44139 RepID=A0A2R4BR12_THAAR|nr:cytochrome c [Thauera aromatica]AVR89786.1 4-cresol dehydrogenase cytochrome c PchC [Thauera aromatica K172]
MHSVSKLALACLAASAMQVAAAQDGPAQPVDPVYAKVCTYCHDQGIGPKILGRQLQPAYIEHVVRYGFRAMPSFRSAEIDDKALAGVIQWVSASPAGAGQ